MNTKGPPDTPGGPYLYPPTLTSNDAIPLTPNVAQQFREEHELVAGVAVELPGAGVAVDDRLERAEPALGWCAAPR